MTITKLVMTLDRHFRYNPTEVTYHINDEVAKEFARRKIAEGHVVSEYDCEGKSLTYKVGYCVNFFLDHVEVNEGSNENAEE